MHIASVPAARHGPPERVGGRPPASATPSHPPSAASPTALRFPWLSWSGRTAAEQPPRRLPAFAEAPVLGAEVDRYA